MNPIREALKLDSCGGYKIYIEVTLKREGGNRGVVWSRENGLIPDVDGGTHRGWHMVRVGSGQ